MTKGKFEHYEWFEIHNDIKKKNIFVIREKKPCQVRSRTSMVPSLVESSRLYPLDNTGWLTKTHVYFFIPYSSKKKHPLSK